MKNNIQQQILEELEIRSLYFKLNEKALQRSLKIWNKHYQNNLSKPLGTIILLKKIRVKNIFLFDTQRALIDLELNKQFYTNFKK
jgi:hypothetical protein